MDLLSDYGTVSEELYKRITEEQDIEVLKKWNKLSARVKSIDEFEKKIDSELVKN